MGDQRHAPAALPPGKRAVPMVQEVGWGPGPVWTGAEYLAPPGFHPRTAKPVASRCTDCAILIFSLNLYDLVTGKVNFSITLILESNNIGTSLICLV